MSPLQADFIGQPDSGNLGHRIINELESDRWERLDAAIAFVKMSGVKQIANPLFTFANLHQVTITVGVDQGGSSLEGVQTLWLVLGGQASQLLVLKDPRGSPSRTFHPKIWMFSNLESALLICGSGNLTGGGLFTNYEACFIIETEIDDPIVLNVRNVIRSWSDNNHPEVMRVDGAVMQQMHDTGELPSENASNRVANLVHGARAYYSRVVAGGSGLFHASHRAVATPAAPPMPQLGIPPVAANPVPRVPLRPGAGVPQPAQPAQPRPVAARVLNARIAGPNALHEAFLMEVNPRQKTEIYLAKLPLMEDPVFFGWPFLGRTIPRGANPPQPQPDPLPTASITVYNAAGGVAQQLRDPSLKLWTYSYGRNANDDFRMTLTGGLQRLVPDGSVLEMIREPANGDDFEINIYPPGHPLHAVKLGLCNQVVRGGRRFGWQ